MYRCRELEVNDQVQASAVLPPTRNEHVVPIWLMIWWYNRDVLVLLQTIYFDWLADWLTEWWSIYSFIHFGPFVLMLGSWLIRKTRLKKNNTLEFKVMVAVDVTFIPTMTCQFSKYWRNYDLIDFFFGYLSWFSCNRLPVPYTCFHLTMYNSRIRKYTRVFAWEWSPTSLLTRKFAGYWYDWWFKKKCLVSWLLGFKLSHQLLFVQNAPEKLK